MSGSGIVSTRPSGVLPRTARRTVPGSIGASGPALRSTDRLIDLLDELSGERDSDGNSVGIIHASDRSLHNPAEMKREPIGRLGGPHAIADRVEVVAEVTKL